MRGRTVDVVSKGERAKHEQQEKRDILDKLEEMPKQDQLKAIAELFVTSNLQEKDLPLSEFLNASLEYKKANGITPYNTMMNLKKVNFIDKKDSDFVVLRIKETQPTHVINIDRASDLALIDLWMDAEDDYKTGAGYTIPSDIIFNKQIVHKDIRIIVDERGSLPGGIVVSFRVVIFDDYEKLVDGCTNNTMDIIGAIVDETSIANGYEFVLPLVITKGVPFITGLGCAWFGKEMRVKSKYNAVTTNQTFSNAMCEFLSTWYALQLAFSDEKTKELFVRQARVKSRPGRAEKIFIDKTTRTQKYIVSHSITHEDIINTIEEGYRIIKE